MRCHLIDYLIFIAALCSPGIVEAGQENSLAKGEIHAINKDCALCHLPGEMKSWTASLIKPVSDLCIECHPDKEGPNRHAVDIVPPMKVERLPLTEGKLTCTTCHDPHANPYGWMLRLPSPDLCLVCHPFF